MKTRLAKFLSDNGIASRRESERLIESGAVSVDGEKVTTPVFFVSGGEKIMVNGSLLKVRGVAKVYVFNKPINTITSVSDPSARKTIYDALPIGLKTLKYVGRLDFKTTGLLLLTDDGELARKLTLPSSGLRRVYIATLHPDKKNAAMRRFLSPTMPDDSIFEGLRRGAVIDGVRYAPMEIEVTARYPITVKIILREGKKNEIRVAMAHIGFLVKKLHRISYGPIELGNLSDGQMRELSQKEIDALRKSF